MNANNSNVLISVQILRALAAWCVVIDHELLFTLPSTPDMANHYIGWVIGTLGVTIFFAISGLLMVQTSYTHFGKPGAARLFLLKRSIRIVPMYWLFTGIVLAGTLVKGHSVSWLDVLRSFAFIPYSSFGEMRPVLGVGWTLNYEMFFYLLFAITLMFRRQASYCVLFGLFLLALVVGTTQKSIFDTSEPTTTLAFWTSPLIVLFPLGCVIALLRQKILSGRAGLWKLPVSPALVAALIVGLGVWAVTATAKGGIYPMSVARQSLLWGAALMAVAVCALTENPHDNAMNRWLVLVGNASYATYLSHPFTIRYTGRALGSAISNYPTCSIAIMFIAATAVGITIHKWIEQPLLSLFRSEANFLNVFRAALFKKSTSPTATG